MLCIFDFGYVDLCGYLLIQGGSFSFVVLVLCFGVSECIFDFVGMLCLEVDFLNCGGFQNLVFDGCEFFVVEVGMMLVLCLQFWQVIVVSCFVFSGSCVVNLFMVVLQILILFFLVNFSLGFSGYDVSYLQGMLSIVVGVLILFDLIGCLDFLVCNCLVVDGSFVVLGGQVSFGLRGGFGNVVIVCLLWLGSSVCIDVVGLCQLQFMVDGLLIGCVLVGGSISLDVVGSDLGYCISFVVQ